jgi:zinc protease
LPLILSCSHLSDHASPRKKGIPVLSQPLSETSAIQVKTLPSGLRVLRRLRPGVGVVALQAWVEVGSADEASAQEGLAHVHEHMLFKGTQSYEQGAIDATVASLGGEINAWTSFDETVYHLVLPKEAAGTGMSLLADLLQRPLMQAKDLDSELEVVAEEIRQDQDSPGRKLSQALFTQAYGAEHPYGRDVAGSLEAVARIDHTKLLGFYKQFYRPERVLLVVDGDLTAAEFDALVAKEWGSWTSAEAPKKIAIRGPAARGSSLRLLREPVAQAHFGFAFTIDELSDEQRADLGLLAAVLGQGESSRLVRELQYERQLVNAVFAYGFDPRGPGMLVVGGMTDGQRLREALDAVIRSLLRVAAHGVDDDALQRAKAQLLAQAVFQNETVQDEASRLAHFEMMRGGWVAEEAERKAIASATPARLKALSQVLISENRQHLTIVLPEGAEPGFTETTLAAVSSGSWAAGTSELKLVKTLPKADELGRHSLRLASGVEVVLWPNPQAQVTAILATWVGGQLLETTGTSGVHGLLSEVLVQASERYSEVELAQRIDRMGASLGALPGRSSFGLRGEVLSERFDEFFELFIDVLKRPRIDQEAVDRERSRMIELIRSRDDRPAQRAYSLGLKAIFGDHPYGMPLEGEEEPLRHLSAEQLREHYHEHYASRPPTLVVVGNFAPERLLEQLIAAFPVQSDGRPEQVLAPTVEHLKPKSLEPQWIDLERSQVQVVRSIPGLPIGDKREAELVILLEILGGSSGRLFQELREERGLTYGISASAVIGLRGGALTVHYSTAPERLDESLKALDACLGRFITEGPNADELLRAKRYLKGARVVARQTAMARGQELVLDMAYGLGLGRSEALHQELDKVSAAQVQALAEHLFNPANAHTLLLGPKAKAQSKPASVSLLDTP